MKVKRGKEQPVNNDRGVSHVMVGESQLNMCSSENLQIIAAVAGVAESYHNLKVIFDLLDLDQQKACELVSDLKASAIILGMQSARAK
jgi:hypothetical protein